MAADHKPLQECSRPRHRGGIKSDMLKSDMRFGDWPGSRCRTHSKPEIHPATQAGNESRIRLHTVPEIGSIPLNKLPRNDLRSFTCGSKTPVGSPSRSAAARGFRPDGAYERSSRNL